MTREEFLALKGIDESAFQVPETKTEDILLEVEADHEERICLLELGV